MKRSLLVISLLVNLVLLGFLLFRREQVTPEAAASTTRTQVLTRTVVQEVTAPVETNFVQETAGESFHWNSIQSTNFPEYAEKLWAIGCPDQTVRDIITGEINDWMLEKRRILITPHTPRFWELAAEGGMNIPKDLKEPLKELKKTRDQLIAQALEKVALTNDAPPKNAPKKDGSLAMLSEEKLQQIQDINKKYADLRKAIDKDKALGEKEKNERRQALMTQLEAEKQAVLSPEELTEYKVRRESHQFQNLYGFETNPEEMRKIAEVYAKNSTWSNDPGFSAEIETARSKQRDDELKVMMGEKRYSEYKRASEDTYQQLWRISEAYKLPPEAAAKAYDLQVATREQLNAVAKDASLSREQKRASMEEIQDAFDNTSAQILGKKAAGTYRKLVRD